MALWDPVSPSELLSGFSGSSAGVPSGFSAGVPVELPSEVSFGFSAGVPVEPPSGVSFGFSAGVPVEPPSEVSFGFSAGVPVEPPSEVSFGFSAEVPVEPPSEVSFGFSAEVPVEPPSEVSFGFSAGVSVEPPSEVPFGFSAGVPSDGVCFVVSSPVCTAAVCGSTSAADTGSRLGSSMASVRNRARNRVAIFDISVRLLINFPPAGSGNVMALTVKAFAALLPKNAKRAAQTCCS